MPATIKQIAAAAGVSRGTVDRVLHNRSGVKPEIAVHVRQIAKDQAKSSQRANSRSRSAVSCPALEMPFMKMSLQASGRRRRNMRTLA